MPRFPAEGDGVGRISEGILKRDSNAGDHSQASVSNKSVREALP
jgi:hypothetical protein